MGTGAGLTSEQGRVVHTLCARDDLLPSDENIKGVAIALILRVRHCVEGPDLHVLGNSYTQHCRWRCSLVTNQDK